MRTSLSAAKKARAGKSAGPAIPDGAERAGLPLALTPQLATLVEAPPAGTGWIYEVKFDGYRVLARIDGGDVRLFTRNGNDWSARLKTLRQDVRGLAIGSAWLDGEIAALDARGLPSFQLLQRAFDASSTQDIVYFVFDLPWFGGYDLRRVPLVERRALLQRVLEGNAAPRVRFSEAFDQPVAKLLARACAAGLEGLVGKRADAGYTSARSTAWVKIKCTRRQEFVVCGYTDPKASRSGFGSLLLGVHDNEGKLLYAGNVGTGFDTAQLACLKARLAALETDKMPFAERPKGVKGHWVKPKLVAEVAFTEWTGAGRIRHPTFQGLRGDKDPDAITREKPLRATKTKAAPASARPEVEGVAISRSRRMRSGTTKR